MLHMKNNGHSYFSHRFLPNPHKRVITNAITPQVEGVPHIFTGLHLGAHLLTGLKYSGASGVSHTSFPVVQFIRLQYSVLFSTLYFFVGSRFYQIRNKGVIAQILAYCTHLNSDYSYHCFFLFHFRLSKMYSIYPSENNTQGLHFFQNLK